MIKKIIVESLILVQCVLDYFCVLYLHACCIIVTR